MRHLDLFSGIGGFALSAYIVWAQEYELLSFCEIDKTCWKTLQNFGAQVPIHDDINTLKGDCFGAIDLITAGYPCQGESLAGKRKGTEDDRWLWPEAFRIIREGRPSFFIGENTLGHKTMGLDQVLSDLESIGYTARPFIIPACAQGANHIRYRVWILAYINGKRLQKFKRQEAQQKNWPRSNRFHLPDGERKWHPSEIFIRRGVPRIPGRVDKIRQLGNAIYPATVIPIMQAIKDLS